MLASIFVSIPKESEINLNENARDIIEELKLRLLEAKQMEQSLKSIEELSAGEKAQMAKEWKDSRAETLEAMESTAIAIKELLDRAVAQVNMEYPEVKNVEEIVTRFLRAKDASEMLEVIAMLENKLPQPLEQTA